MKETLCSHYLFKGSALENDVDETAASKDVGKRWLQMLFNPFFAKNAKRGHDCMYLLQKRETAYDLILLHNF